MTRHVIDLVRTLPQTGWEVAAVLAPEDDRLGAAVSDAGAEFVAVPMADRLDPLADRHTEHLLEAELSRLAPDVVHMHSNKAALLGTRALRKAQRRPATVFSAHNVPSFEKGNPLYRWAGRRALRDVGRAADRTIAVSMYLASRLIEDAGFDAGKVDVVHNGVDVDAIEAAVAGADRAALRRSVGIPEDACVIGTMGRLVADKGVDVLLAAQGSLEGRHEELWTLVIGDGPDEQRLRAVAEQHRIADRVAFLGFVDDPYPWFAAMDCAAIPTLQEAFGMAALEALAAGVPVIASDVGGVPEIVTDSVDGMLVPPGQSAAWAHTITFVLMDAQLRERLAVQGPRTARSRFSLSHMAECTAAVYEAAMGGE